MFLVDVGGAGGEQAGWLAVRSAGFGRVDPSGQHRRRAWLENCFGWSDAQQHVVGRFRGQGEAVGKVVEPDQRIGCVGLVGGDVAAGVAVGRIGDFCEEVHEADGLIEHVAVAGSCGHGHLPLRVINRAASPIGGR
ncbi:hypothetical protein AB0F15_39405 [Amycolatopsis sp. NPDC026612]|uniref:hypothetical protein n=1 Tax=Amycolatopsis sp. NPDC026612 TaxID=3155466 RepID=UPI003409E32C